MFEPLDMERYWSYRCNGIPQESDVLYSNRPLTSYSMKDLVIYSKKNGGWYDGLAFNRVTSDKIPILL
jgi:hypothetical protein